MKIDVLYLISFLLPLVLMPLVLPVFVLLAHRKRIMDSPNARKLQERPVAVIGGSVIMLVICVTSVVVNLFYDITPLFPVLCVMFMLYIFGTIDDTVGMDWKIKLGLQAFAITLLFFGSEYGVHLIYGFQWMGVMKLTEVASMPIWISFPITLLCGLLLFNAVNFADGIDGLASVLGILTGLTMGYWHMRHGFEIQTIISLIMVGVMASFFVFNVFSKRYKIYMGDSGSLVLGLFIYVMVCDNKISMLDGSFLADNYSLSFVLAVISYMVFDLMRVVLVRTVRRKALYEGDRSHLHHIYVDLGMNHLMATLVIMLCNMMVIGVWYVTAKNGMPVAPQMVVLILVAMMLYWLPYFVVTYLHDKREEKYMALMEGCKRVGMRIDKFVVFVEKIIDRKLKVDN